MRSNSSEAKQAKQEAQLFVLHYNSFFFLRFNAAPDHLNCLAIPKITPAKLCGFFFLDVFAGTVRSGEKRGQQWSEVVVRNKINKLRNVCDDFVLVVASR